MEYYICSTSVFDNLYLANGEIVRNVPGGAGIYALAGAKLWAENVNLVCGVGNDYNEKMEDWFKQNKISMNNLRYEEYKTPLNDVHYDTEEDRKEIPEFGANHYKVFETNSEEFTKLAQIQNVGVYVFRNTDKRFWNDFNSLDSKEAFILWEIAGDACKPQELMNIKKILKKIDVFSLNFEEAVKLFDTEDSEEIIEKLKKLDVPMVFLRQGKKGQTFITKKGIEFVPSIQTDKVVDVTGGGNSSSGAVLVGASQNYSIEDIGEMANKSAIMCLSQLGIPKKIETRI